MSTEMAVTRTEPNTSFGSLKQIDAGVLNVGYAEAGPGDGPAVILLHGWPYDIHSYVEVAPLLAAHGYRVIVPYLRGTRPGRVRAIPARVCQAYLAARLAALGLRPGHLRTQRRVLRQPRSRGHRDPQLSLAPRPDRRRAQV
jgi:dienelactone hydrolase